MGSFNYETGKHRVEVSDHADGSTTIKTTPKDLKSDGAAEVGIDRQRGDDGSVTVVVTPKLPAADDFGCD